MSDSRRSRRLKSKKSTACCFLVNAPSSLVSGAADVELRKSACGKEMAKPIPDLRASTAEISPKTTVTRNAIGLAKELPSANTWSYLISVTYRTNRTVKDTIPALSYCASDMIRKKSRL